MKRALLAAAFFVSLAAIFALLIWQANRFPAGPRQPHQPDHREVR
jgi:hypothetical protein